MTKIESTSVSTIKNSQIEKLTDLILAIVKIGIVLVKALSGEPGS